MGSDPVLSGITFVVLVILAVFTSVMLCVFTPNQVFWFGGLSFFTPPELQDYMVDSMFQQLTKTQEMLLSWYTRTRNRSVVGNDVVSNSQSDLHSDSQTEAEHIQTSVPFGTTSGISSIPSNVSTVSEFSSYNHKPITSISRSKSSIAVIKKSASSVSDLSNYNVYMNDDEEETEFVERETFRTMQLFSYNWLKTQTYKWLKMVPDDVELRHRHICSVAMVTKDQLLTRLPVKKKQFHVTSTTPISNYDMMSSLLNTGSGISATNNNSSLGEYVSAWMKRPSNLRKSSFSRSATTRTNSTYSGDDIDDFESSLLLPRALGELFPNKAKPIVISIPDPTKQAGMGTTSHGMTGSPGKDQSKVFTVSVNIIAARGLQVKESVRTNVNI
jgi:hypothetical protein